MMTKVKRTSGALSSEKPVRQKAEVESTDDVMLPNKLSVPSTHIGDYSTLLFGLEKVGKTTLAAMFPKTLFLMFEPGGKALSIYQMPMLSWAAFRKALKLLEKDKRFNTIVVDTVDIAFKMCERFVCRKHGIDHPSDEDWGKGWNAIRDEFTERMATLLSLGKGVILISHAAEKEIKKRSGEKYHVVGPTMAGQAKSVIQPMVDIWCYYDIADGRRVLTVRGDDHVMAGVRPQNNFLHNGKPLSQIDMGESPAEAYRNFIDAFNNVYEPHKKTTTIVRTKKVG